MNWCILIPLIIGLLSALFGYLLGRLFSGGKDNTAELEWQNKLNSLEKDLHYCNDKLSAANIEIKALSSLTPETVAPVVASITPKSKPKAKTTEVKSKTSKTTKAVSTSKAKPMAAIDFDASLAKSVFGKKIKQDDLKVIEGIGPKIEELFHNFDINTWKSLSETSVEKCQEVLNSGGSRYKIHNPGTWPKQALLAYKGKWQELLNWQNKLDGGKM